MHIQICTKYVPVVDLTAEKAKHFEKGNTKNVSFQETTKLRVRETYNLPPEALEVFRRARAAQMSAMKSTS